MVSIFFCFRTSKYRETGYSVHSQERKQGVKSTWQESPHGLVCPAVSEKAGKRLFPHLILKILTSAPIFDSNKMRPVFSAYLWSARTAHSFPGECTWKGNIDTPAPFHPQRNHESSEDREIQRGQEWTRKGASAQVTTASWSKNRRRQRGTR